MKERTSHRIEKIKNVLEHRQPTLTVILANIGNEHNVSAIYRTCDALGVLGVHLYYTHTPFPSIGNTVSASSRKWVETYRHSTAESLRESLINFQILATKCSPQARPMGFYNYTKPTALLFGNEHSGVDEELLPYTDGEVYIPMYGMVQSFNVSVAVGILLSECVRQRQENGMYNNRQLSNDSYNMYMEKWIEK